MTVIESLVPALEVYSIDEAFADLSGMPESLDALARALQSEIKQKTAIPVGIGIASTKTLAKLANHAAKRWQRQTGGVVDLRDGLRRDNLLKAMPVESVWGIGKRTQVQLNSLGIKTAWDLASADTWMLRKRFNVLIEKTARELRGTACLELEEAAPAKQEICCSRSFGKRLKTLEPIQEAITAYAARAAEKLRQQGSLCRQIRISLRTGMFNPDEARYANGLLCQLPYPTDDTRLIIAAAREGIARLYRDGFSYAKAHVLLLDLCRRDEYTQDLFTPEQPVKTERLMSTLDAINARWGRGTLCPGRIAKPAEWSMRRQHVSQAYTTDWAALLKVKAQ